MTPDPYDTLGIAPDATPAEIRAAFREKVRASHPDTSIDAGGENDVIAVVEAYRRLMGDADRPRSATLETDAPGSTRRIEVRRRNPTDAMGTSPARCGACGGHGVVMVWSECPGCRGAGTITRLDLHGARAVVCPRCRGRAGAGHRAVCSSCGGSGTIAAAPRQ
ncbi:MAG: DnaJ domain-containing protein [Acidimicrobiia bacterium]